MDLNDYHDYGLDGAAQYQCYSVRISEIEIDRRELKPSGILFFGLQIGT